MDVIVKDDQGLGMLLMMDGFSKEQIVNVKNQIRQQFSIAAQVVFKDVLGKKMPETIVVNVAQNDIEEVKEGNAVRLASFDLEVSSSNHLVFSIREIAVKMVLEHPDSKEFLVSVYHEMVHAADYPILFKSRKMFEELSREINNNYAECAFNYNGTNIALLTALTMFEHYRAEGIAILGSNLLLKKQFILSNSINHFRHFFILTMMKSISLTSDQTMRDDYLDEVVSLLAYEVAPILLLMVLNRHGHVDGKMAQKVIAELNTGCFDLTDKEINGIIQASFSLSLSEYIQGLVSLGDAIAPIQHFMEFCAVLQTDWENANMDAFMKLLRQPETLDVFNDTMRQIMGCVIPEEEIDEYYTLFCNKQKAESDNPQLKRKVDALYFILKTDKDVNRKMIAQWSLTYLFDEQDIINDNLVGIGLVDDMMVIDYALKII